MLLLGKIYCKITGIIEKAEINTKRTPSNKYKTASIEAV